MDTPSADKAQLTEVRRQLESTSVPLRPASGGSSAPSLEGEKSECERRNAPLSCLRDVQVSEETKVRAWVPTPGVLITGGLILASQTEVGLISPSPRGRLKMCPLVYYCSLAKYFKKNCLGLPLS